MRLLALALLALSTAANASDAYHCGYQVVSVGASVGKLTQACGQPSRIVQLQTSQGGAAGERYEYDKGRKTVLFWIRGGRVVRIEQLM
jgi:hypothetical protein